ncbi:TonB-linked SusC/RagA family outer membrane protein [Dysgonomonas sp. PFB1-18]|nr:TonB-linked SusC/RagA family outer membrane protein [Dysgonomonas sp. PF1-14]MDH6340804.1 TonB-linked SusC/RagA family outer membrane protein [Dysgonomonas sp. PF1-16]MDH6382410.1 TonB-linked SusC/RagA family outer membrane protein [Dysgonomonas sp. PFB1-18]MDH6399773.1 TonB-linked SusC/RagA family outer membrane protein [Dysgonomonas sp. PF1-23]
MENHTKQKRKMRRKGYPARALFLLLITVFQFFVVSVFAQSVNVKGKVLTSEGKPIENAIVQTSSMDKDTKTDKSGIFSIRIEPKEELIVVKEGFISQKVSYNGESELVINLSIYSGENENNLVNILYGKRREQNITAAVSHISGATVENNPIVSNNLRLAGYLPGLMVLQSNGEPGNEGSRTLLRGRRTLSNHDNTPVFIIDGYERDFSLLDPNEIESITVLKDAAAAAQYGLRSGNGIVLVTTKRGNEGKIKISFNMRAGVKSPTTKPKFLNAYNYAQLYNEAQWNDYDDGTRTQEQLNAFKPEYSSAVLEKYRLAAQGIYNDEMDRYLYPDNNWYNDYVKDDVWQQRYSVDVRGGNKFAKYFVSLGYTNSDGMFKVDKDANQYNTNANFNMFTLRSNVDIQATSKLLLSLDLSARQEQRNSPGERDGYTSRIFQSLYRTPPNAFPVFMPDGSIAGTKDITNNPYGLLNKQGYTQYYIRNIFTTVKAKYDLDIITKGLNLWGEFAFDNWFDQETTRNKTFQVYSLNTTKNEDGTYSPVYDSKGNLSYTPTGKDTQMGTGGSYPGSTRTMALKFSLDYTKQIGDNTIYALLGYSQRQISQENNSNLARQYRGLNTRISYAYKNRYLAEFTAGYEGSEQMPPKNKFGFFPAVSVGWILSEEDFLKGNKLINFLKLRASYGLTGNDDMGGYFMYLERYVKDGGINMGQSATGLDGWYEDVLAQKEVTWEKVRKANIGIDGKFLSDKLSLSFDVFMEKNSDIMVDRNKSLLMGIRLPLYPAGKVDNKGLELGISYSDNIGKDFEYMISGMFSTSKNKIVEMNEITPYWDYQQVTGRSIGNVFGYEAIGFFSQADIDNPDTPSQFDVAGKVVRPGDIMYKDQNGDGVINTEDMVYLGDNESNNFASLALGLRYRRFDFNIQFTGQFGGTRGLNNELAYEFYSNGGVMEHHLNRYNPRDPEAYQSHGMKFYKGDYPRLSIERTANNRAASDFWRVPNDLLRLKSLEIGYTFDKELLKKARIEKLRLYVNGYNLHTWSKTDLVDLEAGSGSGVFYPIQRIWNFGINVTF